MNRFLLVLLTAGLLSSCANRQYPSELQAFRSCLKWRDAGGFFKKKRNLTRYKFGAEVQPPPRYGFVDWARRECQKEDQTNQYLGLEYRIRRGGKATKNIGFDVKKNFRF